MRTVLLVARREFTERARERSLPGLHRGHHPDPGAILRPAAAEGWATRTPARVALVGAGSAGIARGPAGRRAGRRADPRGRAARPRAAERALDDEDVDAVVLDGERSWCATSSTTTSAWPCSRPRRWPGHAPRWPRRGWRARRRRPCWRRRRCPSRASQPDDARAPGRSARAGLHRRAAAVRPAAGVRLLGRRGRRGGEGQPRHRDPAGHDPPRQLLAGKVLGIGRWRCCSCSAWAPSRSWPGSRCGAVDVPADAVGVAAIVLGWFVLGYAFFACAFAAAGALCPRQEELQNATTPLSLVLIASFFLSFTALSDPGRRHRPHRLPDPAVLRDDDAAAPGRRRRGVVGDRRQRSG